MRNFNSLKPAEQQILLNTIPDNLHPLYRGYKPEYTDSCTSTSNNVCHGSEMQLIGYIYKNPNSFTVPLYSGYKSEYNDSCTSTSNDVCHGAGMKVIGHILNVKNMPNTIPLFYGYSAKPMDSCAFTTNNVCHGAKMSLLGYILRDLPSPPVTATEPQLPPPVVADVTKNIPVEDQDKGVSSEVAVIISEGDKISTSNSMFNPMIIMFIILLIVVILITKNYSTIKARFSQTAN